MSNYLKRLFLFMTISFLICSCSQSIEPNSKEEILASDFNLQDLSQNTVHLSSYRNKQAVILFFWTIWCPFCRKELKILKNIYPQLQNDNFELLAINVGELVSKVETFVRNYSLNFRVLLDKDTFVAHIFGVLGIPTYIIVDKKGHIVFRDNYFPKEAYKELVSE